MSNNLTTAKSRQQGQTMIITVLFFVFISLALGAIMLNKTLSSLDLVLTTGNSIESMILADTAAEEGVYRMHSGFEDWSEWTDDEKELEVSVADRQADVKLRRLEGGRHFNIQAEGEIEGAVRKASRDLFQGRGLSFMHGVQAGRGGLELRNSAEIIGDVYSTGPIESEHGRPIKGSAVSSGYQDNGIIERGLIEGVEVQGTANAWEINGVELYRGYAQQADNVSSLNGGGNNYFCCEEEDSCENIDEDLKGSEECEGFFYEVPEEKEPIISDEIIDDWKFDVEIDSETEIIECDEGENEYVIEEGRELGPAIIDCDLTISGQTKVNIQGNIWVTGDLKLDGAGSSDDALTLSLDESLEDESAVIITSGKLDLHNHIDFNTLEEKSSYILLLSTLDQTGDIDGGDDPEDPAVDINVEATGDVFVHAPFGEVVLKQNSVMTEVTGYRIKLRNSAKVIYEEGLQNVVFGSGPLGDYFLRGWREEE